MTDSIYNTVEKVLLLLFRLQVVSKDDLQETICRLYEKKHGRIG